MAVHPHNTPSGVHDTGLPGSSRQLGDLMPGHIPHGAESAPIDIAAVIHHLAMRPREAREFVAGLAHAMIEQIDLITPDPDLEPVLGAPEISATCTANYLSPDSHWSSIRADQTQWAKGTLDDREQVDEDGTDLDRGELDTSDHEPSLGATGEVDQRRWDQGNRRDLEDDADLEACGRAWPRNKAELAAFDGTKPMVARHGGARRTDPPHVTAGMVEEQLRALHDKSRKHVLPQSNLVELRPGTFLFKGGVRG